ncbi:MAG: 30S ribosomal protein S6 [Alphaproteobacteria bacterium]
MRDYELTLVIDPDLTSENRKKLITKIKKLVTDLKGKLSGSEDWGEKKLAYPIKKKELGYYFWLAIKLPAEAPAQLEKKLKLEEGVIRYLLVKALPVVSTPAAVAKGGKRGSKITQ